jgi:hypothetical protein
MALRLENLADQPVGLKESSIVGLPFGRYKRPTYQLRLFNRLFDEPQCIEYRPRFPSATTAMSV